MNKLKILFIIAPFILAGCIQAKTEPNVSGGVHRSRDHGQTFEQISKIDSVGGGKDFSQDSLEFFKFDPTDSNTIYYSSITSGLLVSHNGGNSWKNILANKGIIKNISIDPNEPCHIYAQTSQNIFKSLDCGRRWDNVYLEKIKDRTIKDLAIDIAETNKLFMSLSDGSVLLSEDFAVSWRVWHRFENNEGVINLYLNPKNTQIMYAATSGNFYRSSNQGLDWEKLSNIINKDFDFSQGSKVTKLVFLSEFDDGFYTVSTYGILKSIDGGVSWEELPLLPQPKKDKILSIAVNPANMNEVYYGTSKAIYYSKDGGVNWQTLASPSNTYNKGLLVHPVDTSILYVGSYIPPKK